MILELFACFIFFEERRNEKKKETNAEKLDSCQISMGNHLGYFKNVLPIFETSYWTKRTCENQGDFDDRICFFAIFHSLETYAEQKKFICDFEDGTKEFCSATVLQNERSSPTSQSDAMIMIHIVLRFRYVESKVDALTEWLADLLLVLKKHPTTGNDKPRCRSYKKFFCTTLDQTPTQATARKNSHQSIKSANCGKASHDEAFWWSRNKSLITSA